ncbi:transcriptional coactivator p15/PC4 family protein [bacterium]|nr:transcriptional coactivator p15/PC4 family protein [bacterium]MDB4538615.1 transcriptional coactivator p15/PC4 family protein [bacterium]
MSRVILGEQGGDRQHLIIALDSYQGHRYIDLRLFYRDGDEWSPTRKGITLNRDRLDALLSVLVDHRERVFDHLGTSYVPDEVRNSSEARGRAFESLRHHLGVLVAEPSTGLPSSTMFEVLAEGGRTRVRLNQKHSMIQELGAGQPVAALFTAFARARQDLEDFPGAEGILNELEALWARYSAGVNSDGE